MKTLDGYFQYSAKGSSLRTEVLAGVSTFLALSYIFVVNPAILGQAGMNQHAVLFATIITSSLATLAMGFWARLPFVLAPGMEMNAYVAFYVIGTLGFTWQEALGATFWSAVIFAVLTLSRVREKIIDSIPDRLKSSLSLCVGVFLGLIALKVSGILRYEGVSLSGFGSFSSPEAVVLYVSAILVVVLDRFRVPGAVLISIVGSVILCHAVGVSGPPVNTTGLSSDFNSAFGSLAPSVLLRSNGVNVILVLFLIDFYGSVAKLIGLTMNTNVMLAGKLPRLREALTLDGLGSVLGATLGTSNITVYVESGIGIAMGGRTGIVAVVCGFLMLASFVLAPVLFTVPVAATTGALLFVGLKLCPKPDEIRAMRLVDLSALILMQFVVVLTFAIDRAMLIGLTVYIGHAIVSRSRISPFLIISTVMLALGTYLQLGGRH